MTASIAEMQKFAVELTAMKVRAGELGLFRTMHGLDHATQAVGWEIAAKLDPKADAQRERYLRSRNRGAP